ncbi:hypothetical protein [Paenibacillus sp. P46E]|uniref:pPIWI_RE_Z domain-containing protein n=1 Tax=Paenibacillus sp. P46E TaxID=1349436 RepID=UPI0009631C03|nr:hypothetical protein [Paenibacillus sp. P46E]OKP97658.1 hypothetical protein A3849_14200 [Paenibacillus sp. P46E]
MRQTYWELSEGIIKAFETLQLRKSEINLLVSMELFITGCTLIDPKLSIHQAWSVLVGYNEPILKHTTRSDIITRLRILFPELRTKKNLLKRIIAYEEIGSEYRLYEIKEDEGAIRIAPSYLIDRSSIYSSILEHPIPRQLNTKPFANEKEFTYSRRIRGGQWITFHGKIPESMLSNEIKPLPAYRAKRIFKLSVPYNGAGLATEMDQLLGASAMWVSRAKSVLLESLDGMDLEFVYQGNQHIGGGLGAGKSTFMMMEAYRLVKHEGARVGFIEGSVMQALERVRELRKLGILAVPVIGRTSREDHLNNYLFANSSGIQEVSDWQNQQYESLIHLSDVCIIKALAEDYDRSSRYPCIQLQQDDTSVKCPLAHACGVYNDLSSLQNAEVWVATAPSVLKTRISAVIDPLERTVYEAMYDLLDVVFVDEADQVQKQFDETFLTQYNVFGAADDIFEQLRYESNELTSGYYGQYAGDPAFLEWNDRLRMLDQMIWRIYNKLELSQTLRKDIRNNLIRVAALAGTLSEKLSVDSQLQSRLFKRFSEYASDPYKDPILARTVDEIVEAESYEQKQRLLEQIISKVNGVLKPRVKTELLYAQLEFFLYLCRAEESIKYILTTFPMIQAKLGLSINFSPLFTMQKDYQAFMKEAMTGITLGYKYELPDNEKTGKFKLIEYTAVGRLLLHDWHNLYQECDRKAGPAVVFLSGTSHAPKSAHYDLKTPSEWLLRANRQSSVIQMNYMPVLDEVRGGFYSVSGIRDLEQRNQFLSGMVQHLKPDIEYELKHWRIEGNNRRVLLVVNSYDDVETVCSVFRNDRTWTGRYKALSRDDGHQEDQYSRVLIESFYRERAEVLIVPLLSVGRGYNILDRQGEALFGSVFFLVRPYPIPNDLNYLVQVLHAYLPEYLHRIEGKNLVYDKAVTKLRQISSGKLEHMYMKPDFWSILNPKEREIMGWYTFVPVWQMIGRLLRGGRDAHVYFCDAKFNAKPAGNPEGYSMLEVWAEIMRKNKKDNIFQSLYGPFSEAINNMNMGGSI